MKKEIEKWDLNISQANTYLDLLGQIEKQKQDDYLDPKEKSLLDIVRHILSSNWSIKNENEYMKVVEIA